MKGEKEGKNQRHMRKLMPIPILGRYLIGYIEGGMELSFWRTGLELVFEEMSITFALLGTLKLIPFGTFYTR